MDTPRPETAPSQGQVQNSIQPASANSHLMMYGAIAAIVLVIVGAAGYFLFGQQGAATDPKNELYKGKITIGHVLWPGYLGLYIAEDKGYFTEEGLDVDIVLYDGFGPLSKDYVEGKIQGRASLTVDVVDEAYQGLAQKVVAVIDQSTGADGIVAKEGIKTIPEIKGKRVAFEHGTIEELLLGYALEQANMTLADIVPMDLDPEKAANALADGSADVAVTYEPFMSDALKTVPGSTKIFSTAQAPGLISDLLAFRSDFINENPETIHAFVRAYFKGVNFWKANPEEAHAIIGKYTDVSAEDAAAQLVGVGVLDLRDNLSAFTFAAGFDSLYGNLRRTNDFIREGQYADVAKINTDTLIDDDFIKRLTE